MKEMKKIYEFGEIKYFAKCYLNEKQKKIYCVVERKKSSYHNIERLREYSIKENAFLCLIRLTIERRLEWKMKKAIKFIHREANKNNGLENAIKHVEGIYNLDKHMNL